MANKRLIDANAFQFEPDPVDNIMNGVLFMGRTTGKTLQLVKYCLKAMIDNAPTVDAVVLPCKIGDDVYIIPSKANFDLNILSRLKKNNRVYHQKVAEIVFTQDCWYARGNADKEYGTGRVLLDIFYKKTWFLTQEEAESALAKMDGALKVKNEKCCYDCVFCVQSNAPLETGVQYECANFNSKRYIEISIDPWDKACGDFSGGGEDGNL